MFGRREFLKSVLGFCFLPIPFDRAGAVRRKRVTLFDDFVAGFVYHDGEEALSRIRPGDPLVLRREPENPYDELAIEIYTREGVKLGYVPRDINAVPAAMMDQGVNLTAGVIEVNLPPAPSWQRVAFLVAF
jgi:hypothetical protein